MFVLRQVVRRTIVRAREVVPPLGVRPPLGMEVLAVAFVLATRKPELRRTVVAAPSQTIVKVGLTWTEYVGVLDPATSPGAILLATGDFAVLWATRLFVVVPGWGATNVLLRPRTASQILVVFVKYPAGRGRGAIWTPLQLSATRSFVFSEFADLQV